MSESLCLNSPYAYSAERLDIGSIIDSFLGPYKSLKYIIDDGDTVLSCCPVLLLRTVSQLCPFEHLLEEVLSVHHEHYGCNNITLLAMWYFWQQELKVLLDEGVEPCTIFSCVQACIQDVIALLPVIEVPTGKLFHFLETFVSDRKNSGPSNSSILTSERIVAPSKTCRFSKQKQSHPCRTLMSRRSLIGHKGISYGVMISSRHFSPTSNSPEDIPELLCSSMCNNTPAEEMELTQKDKTALCGIVKRLCHMDFGHNDLISKAWEHQIMFSKSAKFSTDFVAVFPIVGPSSNRSVVDGLLIEISGKDSFVSQRNSGYSHNALMVTSIIQFHLHILLKNGSCNSQLISGDATPDYKHLGFTSTAVVEVQKNVEDMPVTLASTWLNDCIDLILKVSLLLVRGSVDCTLIEACISKSVDIISYVPSQSFKIMAKAFNVYPCPYIIGTDKRNVAKSISLHPWEKNTQISLLNNKEFFVIKKECKTSKHFLQTVVLCHPCPATLSLYEHQFWHGAYRLVLACKSKSVLPGGGMTEKWCCQAILELASNKQGEEAKIFQAIAAGFSRYHRTVAEKMLLCENGPSLDEKDSKIQAWHSSVSLLATMLVDSCIINGYENSQQQDDSSMTENILKHL